MKVDWKKIGVGALKFLIKYVLKARAKRRAEKKLIDLEYLNNTLIDGVVYIKIDHQYLYNKISSFIRRGNFKNVKCISCTSDDEDMSEVVFTIKIMTSETVLFERQFVTGNETIEEEIFTLLLNIL